MTEQEKAAIERLKQQNDEAWSQLIEALAPPLYNRLLELTGDKEKAEDYMQEIFFLIVRAIDKIK